MIRIGVDSLLLTRGATASLAPAALLGNDLVSPTQAFALTSVGNATGGTVSLVGGRILITATAATGSFDYTVRAANGETATGRVGFSSVLPSAGADVFTAAASFTATDLQGLAGDDTLIGGARADTLMGGDGNDTLRGNGGDDQLQGGDGNDSLDGGAGADVMTGGSGDDTYTVDDYSDQVVEAAGAGTDLTRVLLPYYTLAENVESGIAVGSIAFVLSGNAIDNTLTGANMGDYISGVAGNDALFGMAGADTIFGGDGNDLVDGGADNDFLRGGAGDDNYIVDHVADIVYEEARAGIDVVRTTLASFTLPDNFETLVTEGGGSFRGTGNVLDNRLSGGVGADVLSGLAGNDILTGAAGDDTLFGGDGNDLLNGGVGVDRMEGGAGNDTFRVDNVGDVVVELASGGIDTVLAVLADYTLGAQVENLTGIGTSALNGTGNSSANLITGTAGADVLSGLGGNDSLNGNAGNDVLLGGDGSDSLNGGLGADRMEGGTGNDTFTVDDQGDTVIELTGAGIDTVRTNLASFTLGDFLEALTQTESVDFSGTGNLLANTINGGSGNDTRRGLGGNDALLGGLGNDVLIGGLGIDTLTGDGGTDLFRFESIVDLGRTSTATDTVRDLVRAQSDRIDLSAIDADTSTAGDQAFTFVGSAAFSRTAGELRAVTSGANSTVFGDVNGDGVADFAIQVLGIDAMQATDFIA